MNLFLFSINLCIVVNYIKVNLKKIQSTIEIIETHKINDKCFSS